MRSDSCRQCIRRRIQCDAGEPECQKCMRKGISCSGVGKIYSFINCGTAASQSRKKVRITVETSDTQIQDTTVTHQYLACDLSVTRQDAGIDHELSYNYDFDAAAWRSDFTLDTTSCTISTAVDNGCYNLGRSCQSSLTENCCSQLLDPETLMLFDHFSSTVAPAMVAIDDQRNGYRNIILPLAMTNPLVRQAVLVVAALHLSMKCPTLLNRAEKGRAAIIKRLCGDALPSQSNKRFDIPTWTTIILLLVGATITGSQEFVHLFPMLNSLVKLLDNLTILHPQVTHFLWQQTQMFRLFTPLFLDPVIGVAALQQHLNQYLDFLSISPDSAEVLSTLETIKMSIYLARDLYLKETRSELDSATRWLAVEQIRQLVTFIEEDTPGMHALVWTYFIAGAASADHVHREFFLERLRQIHNKTGMRNILTTVDLLQNSVWCLPRSHNWSTSNVILNRVLIM